MMSDLGDLLRNPIGQVIVAIIILWIISFIGEWLGYGGGWRGDKWN
jgi:hypothetical protein